MPMDQSDSAIDDDKRNVSDSDREAEMEAAADLLEQYVSETPTSDLSDEVYTARLSGGERAFVESLQERLNTNKGETIRLVVNLAAAHLQEVGADSRDGGDLREIESTVQDAATELISLRQRFEEMDEISAQLDRIEDRLDRDQREGTTSTEQEQTPAEQTDWDAIDPDEFEHPGEGVDVDLPDPDDLE
jgi:hypothetical protein